MLLYTIRISLTVQIFYQFLKIGLFFIIRLWEFFVYCGYKLFLKYVFCKYFLSVCGFSFCFLNSVFWRAEILILKVSNLGVSAPSLKRLFFTLWITFATLFKNQWRICMGLFLYSPFFRIVLYTNTL